MSLEVRGCIKCPNTGQVKLNNKDVYCQDCFVVFVTHKFRGSLGKHKAIKNGERVMVAISGGPNSTAMLNLLDKGFKETLHKKLKMSPILLHIAEDSINIDEVVGCLIRVGQSTSIPVFVVHLGLIFSGDSDDLKPLATAEDKVVGCEHEEDLGELLSSFRSATAKLDVLEKLRLHLLNRIAENLHCTKVLLGDSGSRLAVRVFTHTSLARGAQIQDDSTFSDRRYPVSFLRPMKDLTAKEVAMLNHYHSDVGAIRSWKHDTLMASDSERHESIQALTEGFLENLQLNFPATVCAIVSTAGKIVAAKTKESGQNCRLCYSSCESDNEDLPKRLCYACQSVLADGNSQLLPLWLKEEVKTI